jgi:2-methylcitrate dehydratase PrpD
MPDTGRSPEEMLASFIAEMDYEKLPPEVVAVAKQAILDSIGVSLAGSSEELVGILVSLARELGGTPVSGIIGTGLRTSPVLAALANGAMAHALDYDDNSDTWIGHPSTVLVPALLSVAERSNSSGKEILTAYVTGFEVGARLGMVVGQDHYAKGWHTTATIGHIGGAAAVARLLKLDARRTQMALAIAASLAGGVRENFGTMTKPLHAGNTARNAVLASLLAGKGFTASENSLTAKAAYSKVLGRDVDYEFNETFQKLGSPFDIITSGLWTKAYPSGAATQSAISAAIQLRNEHSFDVGEVAEVVCATGKAIPRILIHHHPRLGLEGKFSMEYCVAVALLDGEVTLDQFTDERALADDVQSLVTRVKYSHPPELADEFGFHIPGIVTVKLRSGEEFTSRVASPKGRPENPMTEAELRAKFDRCARRVLSEGERAEVIRLVSRLEDVTEIGSLMDIIIKPR